MVESLGMQIDAKALAEMVKVRHRLELCAHFLRETSFTHTKSYPESHAQAEDEDGSGEIEFNEFLNIVKKAKASGAAAKGGFAALINRKANSGPPMKWRSDKKGPGVEVDDNVIKRAGTGWAVQLLDSWHSVASYDAASVRT